MSAPTASKETSPKRGLKTGLPNGRGPGRPKGSRDRRYIAGQAAAQALEHKAWDVVAALLTCHSWRARHEAAKTVLSYALGLPRQTITLGGAFGDLSAELTAALREARTRRAALEAGEGVAACHTLSSGVLASSADATTSLEVEVVEAGTEGEK